MKLQIVVGFLALAVSAYVGLVLVIIPTFFAAQIEDWCRPRARATFAVEAWKSSKFGDPQRYKLANDLVASNRLRSLSEREVEELLDKPARSEDTRGVTRLYYDLAPQTQYPAGCWLLPKNLFLNIESWVLEIDFSGGRVSGYTIRST